MRRSRNVVLLLVAVTMAAAGEPFDPPSPADEVNAFACELYSALDPAKQNLFFSPYSVATAMAMTREGARGETAVEMDAVLHLPSGGAAAAHTSLAEALKPKLVWDHGGDEPRQVPAYELHIANALWGQIGVEFEKSFTTVLRDQYRAPLERIDFADSDKARETINGWVEKQTKDRIRDIVPPPLPSTDSKLALANAIYFRGAWEKPFEKGLTKAMVFFVPKIKLAVPMMRNVDRYAYAETDDAQILELPYRGNQTSMVILLPKTPAGIFALEKQLSGAALKRWLDGLKTRNVAAKIPKFELTCPVNLTETLAGMGMQRAFDRDQADFTGMTRQVPLFVGVVLHKAFVSVDEAGTEAAAATVVMMELGAAPDQDKPIEFVADHPFVFLIRHRPTGCILFMGRLWKP